MWHREWAHTASFTSLTLDKAIEIALALESADRNAKDLQKSQAVHILKKQSPSRVPGRSSQTAECYRCGGAHLATDCQFKDSECRWCKKKGHLARVCRSKKAAELNKPPSTPRKAAGPPSRVTFKHTRNSSEPTHSVETDVDASAYTLFNVTGSSSKPFVVTVQIDGADLPMEVDTGASMTLISKTTFDTLWSPHTAPSLQPTGSKLRTYTGESIEVLGAANVNVSFQEQHKQLQLLVVGGNGPSLLGRDWLSQIRLNWEELHHIHQPKLTLAAVLDKHSKVFSEELGMVRDVTAKLHVDPQAQPRFYKPRSVPYAMKEKVELELDRLYQQGIIEPVQFSEWAAPIVPVLKQSGDIRICGDYKLTVNGVAKLDTYPLPRIEDLFSSLSGGKYFSKLDLAQAYLQLPLDEASRKYVTINTQKGLYQYTRLPFGVASAPSIFQRTMDNLLQGIANVCVYLDDILISGATETDHLHNLQEVLSRLEQAGMHLKKDKCAFLLSQVEYLGHQISQEGLHPTKEKVRAIVDAPAPCNVTQLKSFLGMLNYYSKFLPNLSTMIAPLYSLLHKKATWQWGAAQQTAFRRAKEFLASSPVLVHFDQGKPLVLSCDASPYGIGAVLSHKFDDGSEHPVAFASRSLSPAEHKYAQIDKEGLAIIFGVKRFHQYLLGRKFTIYSDHKPLEHLFGRSRAVPSLASARIQRWALTLGAYNYEICYKPGKDQASADLLSRLPLPEAPKEVPVPADTILLMEYLQDSPITAAQIKSWTDRDPLLSRVRKMLLHGWRATDDKSMKPFQHRRDELSIQDECILWGSRVVIPPPGRPKVIEELHAGHPGISRMKSLARSYVWWPDMDADIEAKVKNCQLCQQNQKSPPAVPMQPWEWPAQPWSRIHIDYAGPIQGKMLLVAVDAHSKWIEGSVVNSATSAITIQKLRSMFATHGLPRVVVSDNGSVFTSSEFQEFMTKNGIRHIRTAPYHPASNGLAERAVQTLKEGLRKLSSGDLETRLLRFLFQYRITPHTTTGQSPAQLLMGRQLRSHLDQLHPDMATRVEQKQLMQKQRYDKHTKVRQFVPGEAVYVRNFAQGDTWLAGKIVNAPGPRSYNVKLSDDRIVRRHVDHIRPHSADLPDKSSDNVLDETIPITVSEQNLPENNNTAPPVPLRRSTRISRPPDRLTITYIG